MIGRLVRKALGTEALILGNRRTAGGVEIMAVAPSEFESVTGGVAPAWANADTDAPAIPATKSALRFRPRMSLSSAWLPTE